MRIIYTAVLGITLSSSLFAATVNNIYVQNGHPAIILSAKTCNQQTHKALYLSVKNPDSCKALQQRLASKDLSFNKNSTEFLVSNNHVQTLKPCRQHA